LSWFGLQLNRKKNIAVPANRSDMEQDAEFMALYKQVQAYTMVEMERCYALYQSLRYIIKNNIPGDLAECGVWKGGSSMLMAKVLRQFGDTNRKIYLYDTFEGMTKPGGMDGAAELAEWESKRLSDNSSSWCNSSLEEVKLNMRQAGYPEEQIVFVKGMVEETLPGIRPEKLALLRLDTDWYASTKHELECLYPLLVQRGILLIDDYGAWQGARKATDEFFSGKAGVLLQRIDWTGRLVIKP